MLPYDCLIPGKVKFEAKNRHDLHSRKKIRPGFLAPVIVSSENKIYEVQLQQWGFISYWQDESAGVPLYTLYHSNWEKYLIKRSQQKGNAIRRCLIPMSAWLEYPSILEINCEIGTPGHAFEHKTHCVAGLCEDACDKKTGRLFREFSILEARGSSPLSVNFSSDRLPLTLEPSSYDIWLSGPLKQAKTVLRPLSPSIIFEMRMS